MSARTHFHFGLMAKPFAVQLRENGFRIKRGGVEALKRCDDDNKSLSRLRLRGVITNCERNRGVERLIKLVVENIQAPKKDGAK